MNTDTMRSALAFDPQVPFNVRADPTDDRRVIIAPESLLDANTTYTLLVGTAALDQDGNQLQRALTIHFSTGAVGTLHHWIAFATLGPSGASGGLWIVNESGLPRQLLNVSSLQHFNWAPD